MKQKFYFLSRVLGIILIFCILSGLNNANAQGQEKIVFAVKIDDDNSEVYTINPNGTGLAFLFSFASEPVDNMGWIQDLRISPNGEYIAFHSNHDRWYSPHQENIFHISSDGSWWDMDTPDEAAGWYNPPGGTGTVYGYVTDFGDPGSHAWVTIEGYPDLITTDATGYYNESGVPEGSRFVTAFSFDYGWYDYVPVNVIASGSVEAPTLDTYQDNDYRGTSSNPAWSPDANYIYWEGLDFAVRKTPRSGGAWIDILPVDNERSSIDISPVNEKIVYVREFDGVYTANPDGTGAAKIFDDPNAYSSGAYYVRWSPDGNRIAYTRVDGVENIGTVIDKNGNHQADFCLPGYYLSIGGWSPDSKWLVVLFWNSTDPDSVYIYTVQPDSLFDNYIIGPANIMLGVDWGVLNPQTGIKEITSQKSSLLKIYPNPCEGVFTLEIYPLEADPSVDGYKLQIYDILGREIIKSKIANLPVGRQGCKSKIDISGYPEGIYFVKVYNEDFMDVVKLVIQ